MIQEEKGKGNAKDQKQENFELCTLVEMSRNASENHVIQRNDLNTKCSS